MENYLLDMTPGRIEREVDGTASWRDRALNEALRAEAVSGESEDALLRAVRRHQPRRPTVLIYLDRSQLLRFLEEAGRDYRRLATVGYYQADAEKNVLLPYIGWYATEWEGETVEVAIPPDWGEPGYVLLLADTEARLERFTRAAYEHANRPAGRCLRYAAGWESDPAMDAEIGKVTWEDVVLPPDLLARIREAVEGFFAHRDAYAALGFAWRRGVLLIGPPGTGKTMACKAAAAALPGLPFLYVRDLTDTCHRDAIKAIFERARQLAPCILALEDMDGFVHEGNRAVFLNEMDGFRNNEGMLILASSNHPGRIDEALLKRPSRFDRVFHIGLPALEERREYCRRILHRSALADRLAPSLDVEALAARMAEATDGFTPAYLKEALVSAALRRAQAGVAVLDAGFAEAALAEVKELRDHLRRMRDPEALAELRSSDAPIGLRR